ncbi:U4/U6.U5 tri-snRNP-associated protein 2 [Leptonychotes weddellii]|uniref:ubiquitinyl hydrolase 1 n=1 Tax=Leptonychotes weddellii TaxID=9713 RepID=A0A7F8R611_LEPWE|nr:U4/U6.U5 tri-snRNP-associated protein 2 [Leptonychotes weddellii]
MSGRSKRESRGSTRGKRESESRGSSGRVKRERDREREAEAPSSRGSPVRVKREVEPVSAREAPTLAVPAVRVKREREADEDSEPEREVRAKNGRVDSEDRRSRHCPYLDTINRSVLDFDFEKLCSISLSHINAYACLVCGKYFQGRGLKSHAYIHSVQFSHHVFLNLHTLKFYCLPDNYEIIDSSLEDITYVLKPTFTKQQIANLDKQAKLSRAYDGTTYLPGIVGLNNIKANDYANAVLQVGSGWKLGEEVTWEHYEGESRNDSVLVYPKEYKTYKENFLKRFQLTKLPPYLIFCIKRFTKNNFFVEKNPTIVNFPITNVDLREYLSEEVQAVHKNTTYDLIANIVHDGKPSEGSYRIHVLHHGTGKWYELQDLQVTDILPQMITLSEAYIQIWKRRDNDETNQQGA